MLTITSYSWTLPATLLFLSFFSCSESCTFTITNNCPYTIWPGTLAGAGTPQLPTTGFQLDSGRSVRIASVPGWSGRIWARTACKFDESGVGTCETGDCGGRLECDGNGATPPASLFEITLGKGIDKDFYDVSIVDGYNLPFVAQPHGVYGACNATGSFYCMLLCCLHKSSAILYICLHRVKGSDGRLSPPSIQDPISESPPSIQDPSSQKDKKMVSSSNIILPLPMPILLILVLLF